MLELYYIRHAKPVAPGTPGFDESSRPLTASGARDATALAAQLSHIQFEAIYSSPYLRAVQTIEPLAKARNLVVQIVPELRERLLSPEDRADWLAQLERSWQDFEYALPGGESSRAAQRRGLAALQAIALKHQAGCVALAGHGNLLALTLNALTSEADFQFWQRMEMPATYRIGFDGVSFFITSLETEH